MRPPTGICFWNDSDEPPPPNQLSQHRNDALWLSVRSLAKIFHCVRETILHYDAIIILARSLCASVGGNRKRPVASSTPSTFEKFTHTLLLNLSEEIPFYRRMREGECSAVATCGSYKIRGERDICKKGNKIVFYNRLLSSSKIDTLCLKVCCGSDLEA
jgi:hypothetical protein